MSQSKSTREYENCPTCKGQVYVTKGLIVGLCTECNTTWNIKPLSMRPNRMVRLRNKITGIE